MNTKIIRVIGLMAVISAMFYFIMGFGWWASTDNAHERAVGLVFAHVVAMVAAAISYL